MTDELVYTVPETARLLKVSERHLRDQIRAGNFPARHLGQRVLIARVDLEAWLEGTWKPAPVRRVS